MRIRFHCCRTPTMVRVDARFVNILQLGFGFFLIFTAFQSCGTIQAAILESVSKRTGEVPPDAGYVSSAIIYGVFTVFNFFAAGIVEKITARWAMVLGGSCYALFLASFLYIKTAFLYTTSAILGLGAALIWVGQGQYLTNNSDEVTMGRNSAVSWAMMQCSLPIGGIILYTQFRDKTDFGASTINIVYISFTCLAAAGVVVLLLLRRPPKHLQVAPLNVSTPTVTPRQEIQTIEDPASPRVYGAAVAGSPQLNQDTEEIGTLVGGEHKKQENVATAILDTFKLLKTTPMLLLAVVFIFTGMELSFWSGIYGTCLSFTPDFVNGSKAILALNAIFIGLGEILGGGSFGIMGEKIHRYVGRSPIVILGAVVHIIAFALIFINIPFDSVNSLATYKAYITPNEYLALFCSVLLGFADSCWNTQIYALLGSFYSENSASAFALFKFFQSGATCAAFFYGPYIQLQWHLLSLAIGCVIGLIAFLFVDRIARVSPGTAKAS